MRPSFRGCSDVGSVGLERSAIADINNHRVCKVDRHGTITTIAGWGAWAWLHGTDRRSISSARTSGHRGLAAGLELPVTGLLDRRIRDQVATTVQPPGTDHHDDLIVHQLDCRESSVPAHGPYLSRR